MQCSAIQTLKQKTEISNENKIDNRSTSYRFNRYVNHGLYKRRSRRFWVN